MAEFSIDRFVDRYAARTDGMAESEVRALFAVASRPEVVSLAGGMPFVQALPSDEVRRVVESGGEPRTLQGNLDPAALLAPVPEIERRTAALLAQGRQGSGRHVVNLGHGILPMTPVDHARAFVEAVKRLSAAG